MKKLLLLAALMTGALTVSADDAVVSKTYGNATGNTEWTLAVALNHAVDYCGFQMDITLPDGFTAADAVALTPLTGWTLDQAVQADGKLRVVGYNLNNTAIAGATGDNILTLKLTGANGAYTDAECAFTNVLFVATSDVTTDVNVAAANTDSRIWGDIIVNKAVDGVDYQAVGNLIAGKAIADDADTFAGNIVNTNNVIDGVDYQAIANKIAGK